MVSGGVSKCIIDTNTPNSGVQIVSTWDTKWHKFVQIGDERKIVEAMIIRGFWLFRGVLGNGLQGIRKPKTRDPDNPTK